MTGFIALGIVLTVIAVAVVVLPLLRTTADGSAPIAATSMAVAIPAAVMLLYLTVSNYGWDSDARPVAPQEQVMAPDLVDALAGLEARLAEQPNDLEGWLLLGNTYIQLQRFQDAREAFRRANDLSDRQDPAAKLGLAEAEILLDRNALNGSAGQLIEDVLLLEPNNPKALWYGGLAALARGDNATVQARWQRLLALSPPEQVRTVIEDQLAALGGVPDATANLPALETPRAAGPEIEVTVSIAEALAPRVAAGASLFLVARDANAAGPPVAVVRQRATELPVTLRISDANVMVPGRSLNELDEIRLVARVANGGDALAKPGDIFGEALLSSPISGVGPVSIVMDQVVQP